MYSKLPNLIIGFHGCDQNTFESVLYERKPLHPSTNSYDWLGNGIYFWEYNQKRAYEWAEQQVKLGKYKTPKVIGAVLDLGHCLNLTDSTYISMVQNAYETTKLFFESIGEPLPKNKGGKDLLKRNLDCAVIEQLHSKIEMYNRIHEDEYWLQEKVFDSVRGVFTEGKPIYPDSGIMEKTHIQICIRNPNCIKGYFDPLETDTHWNMP